MFKMICSFGITLFLLAVATRAAHADATFDISPTSGAINIYVTWTDEVTLSSSSSTWTEADLTGSDLWGGGTPVDIEVPNDPMGPYANGGGMEVENIEIDAIGWWDFHQINKGKDPNNNWWYWGSQDIEVYAFMYI